MTLLTASIFVERVDGLQARCDAAWRDGADAIELRIDALEEPPAALNGFLKAHPERNWIVTCRSRDEGGRFAGDTAERVALLIAAAQGTNAIVDFEFADWRRSANIRQKVLLAATGADGRRRLILSSHNFSGPPNDVDALIREMLDAGRASLSANDHLVAKVAYTGRGIADSFAALDAMHAHGNSVIAICMGEHGTWTRMLARKLGAFATYAATDELDRTAPGQLSLQSVDQCRWDMLNSETRLYGVIGDPVSHSLSPMLFNHWFDKHNLNAAYFPLRVGEAGLTSYLDGCMDRPWLNVCGLSVTIPHKEAALRWSRIESDPLCVRLGALNTLAFDGNRVQEFNTDCYAAFDSLLEAWGRDREQVRGTSVDILGAGGAARAIILPLLEYGASVTVYGRSADRLQCIQNKFVVSVAAWSDRIHRTGDVLINTTPIGMWPNVNESPMPEGSLNGCDLVFDMIYRPMQTKLLCDAVRAECKTAGGLDMFVRQAMMQMELWSGIRPDRVEALTNLKDFLAREVDLSERCAEADRTRRQATALTCHVFLIGMRGSGKTTVGRRLAERLGVPHIDTDDLVTAEARQSIREIFDSEGEAAFRRRETKAIRQAIPQRSSVVSLGGGAVLDPANVEAIRKAGMVVWLEAAAEVLYERIRNCPTTPESRPPLTSLPELEELQKLMADRGHLYRIASHFAISTEHRTVEEISREIHEKIFTLTMQPERGR